MATDAERITNMTREQRDEAKIINLQQLEKAVDSAYNVRNLIVGDLQSTLGEFKQELADLLHTIVNVSADLRDLGNSIADMLEIDIGEVM